MSVAVTSLTGCEGWIVRGDVEEAETAVRDLRASGHRGAVAAVLPAALATSACGLLYAAGADVVLGDDLPILEVAWIACVAARARQALPFGDSLRVELQPLH